MSKKHPIYNKDGESTSTVSKVSYDIETLLVDGAGADDIQIYTTSLYKDENFPSIILDFHISKFKVIGV
ncbi:hypothetical protein ACWOFR_08660 [Carnobacterium gallinarum]|uniref:hypothetical protein n=1 Tax=Carnobacterium gallinarum TaxID=2749 RepID=UPI0005508BB4|nr:hypothetical protein [Carnobacterium gallinarum]